MPTVSKIIRPKHLIGGVLTDYTSLTFGNQAAIYGARRTDTAAQIVAAGVALNHDGTGLYSYTFPSLTAGAPYDYWLARTYGGRSWWQQYNFIAPTAADDLPRYLEVDEAVALAGSIFGVDPFLAANGTQQQMALSMATWDLDNGQRYQGRKYDPSQTLEFPRIAYESGRLGHSFIDQATGNTIQGGEVIWDWDGTNSVAIVPSRVKLACLYQANSRLDPKRIAVLDRIYSGLTSRQIGTGAEAYDLKVILAASGGALQLCRDAVILMQNYQLRAGRLL